MTEEEKREVIKKMGLGNKYVNRVKRITIDFITYMHYICATVFILAMIKLGINGILLFLRDSVVIYIVAKLIIKVFYICKRLFKRLLKIYFYKR